MVTAELNMLNLVLGVIGSLMTLLLAITAYFLNRLINQLDATTLTVGELSKSFQVIATSFESFKREMDKYSLINKGIEKDVIKLKSEMAIVKNKLDLI